MAKNVFMSEKGLRPIGPYSTATMHNGTVYLSGMIPMDPDTNTIINGSIEEETERVFKNLEIVLEEMGLSFSDVLKVNLYLTDMGDFAKVNEIYARYFVSDCPARSTIQAAALPKGIKVEIDLIAASR